MTRNPSNTMRNCLGGFGVELRQRVTGMIRVGQIKKIISNIAYLDQMVIVSQEYANRSIFLQTGTEEKRAL